MSRNHSRANPPQAHDYLRNLENFTHMQPNTRLLLPLGALLLSASAFTVAQEVKPVPKAEEKQTIEPITVTGANEASKSYQPGLTTVGKTPALPKDIPQSLTIVTNKLITDQGQDTVKGALQNVPGITFEAGEGGRIGDNIRLRGFTVAGDIYSDGMRDIAQYNRDTFNVERIEVLRGSASMLFGRGSTGGIVNMVSKQPSSFGKNEVTLTAGTDQYFRAIGDFSIKAGEDAGLRASVMLTEGEGRAGEAQTQRKGAALDYRLGIGTPNEFMFSAYHLHYNDKPDYGFGWLESRPAPPPSNRKWYGVDSDYQKDSADVFTAAHTHRFQNGDTLKTTLRDGRYERDLWATTARPIAGTTLTTLNDSTVVTRGNQTRAGAEHHVFAQTDFVSKRNWFGFKNEVLVGAEIARERSSRDAYASVPTKPNTVFGEPAHAAVVDTRVRTFANEFIAETKGVYVQNTLNITEQFKVIGGLRLDRFEGDYFRSVGGPLSRRDSLLSKRAGAMFQPDDSINYYVTYSTSFNTSGDLYQYDPTTANTPAESARNVEIGVKKDWLSGDLSLRASLSRSEKLNERSTDTETVPGGTGYLLSGKRHTDAFELEAAGRLSPKWEVFAGFVLSHAEIDKAGSSPTSQATVGLNPGLTPTRQGNVWTTYQFTEKWRVGGGAIGVSQNKPAAAETTTNRAPGYVKFDALVEYQISAAQVLRLNVENIGDKVYYSSLYRGHAVPGTARNARLTWNIKF
jgi:catecholate siderophore receptor